MEHNDDVPAPAPMTLEQRVMRLEGGTMLVQQLFGLLLSESPRAADRLLKGLARPDALRDILMVSTMPDEQIDGAQAMLTAVVERLRGSLPQRGD